MNAQHTISFVFTEFTMYTKELSRELNDFRNYIYRKSRRKYKSHKCCSLSSMYTYSVFCIPYSRVQITITKSYDIGIVFIKLCANKAMVIQCCLLFPEAKCLASSRQGGFTGRYKTNWSVTRVLIRCS